MIGSWFRTAMMTALSALILFAGIQTIRVNNLVDHNKKLKADMSNMLAAQVLTDQLRKANSILNKDQDDISGELRTVQGYVDPLSPDVIRVLDRLHTGTTIP